MGQHISNAQRGAAYFRGLSALALVVAGCLSGLPVLLGLAAPGDGGAPSRSRTDGAQAGETSLPQVRVRIEALATRRTGATEATEAPLAGVARALTVGEDVNAYLAAGQPGDLDLCDIASAGWPLPALPHDLWTINAHVVATSPDQTTLRIAWTRSVAAGQGLEVQDQDTRVVTLAPGQYHIIDVARSQRPGSRCTSLLVRLSTGPDNRLLLARSLLSYDVWLVHRARDGRETVRHQQMLGPADAQVSFYLRPFRWRLNGEPVDSAAGAQNTIELAVAGTVRTRRQSDGSLDVSVRAGRLASCGQGYVRGEGEGSFRAVLGERLALELPAPTGPVEDTSAGVGFKRIGRLAEGVQQLSDKIVVDFRRFFDGHEFWLHVSVRPEGS